MLVDAPARQRRAAHMAAAKAATAQPTPENTIEKRSAARHVSELPTRETGNRPEPCPTVNAGILSKNGGHHAIPQRSKTTPRNDIQQLFPKIQISVTYVT